MSKANAKKKHSRKKQAKPNLRGLFATLALGLILALAVGLMDLTGLADLKKDGAALPALRFSEIQSDNAATIPSATGEAPDWIELENAGDTPVSLKGISMMIDEKINRMFNFPNRTLAPGELILVYADGSAVAEADGALHAPFRLPASGGAKLYLFDAGNAALDMVEIPEMEPDTSYRRAGEGWEICYNPTPGAGNDSAPAVRGMEVTPGALEISEAMSANNAFFPDENGLFHDYAEIRNISGRDVNLAGYWLSDDNTLLRKYALPDIILPAGGQIALHCSGLNRSGDPAHLHTNFKLSSKGESLYLTDSSNTIVSAVTLPALLTGQACSLVGGEWTAAFAPTPGEENSIPGAARANQRASAANTTGVCISEVMCAPVNENYDWVELYNAGPAPVDLSGFGLSDELSQPRKWQFPEGSVIQPQARLAVFLTGSEHISSAEYLCAPFALSAEGGYSVSLSTPRGEILDMLYLPMQAQGISYGRGNSGETGYLSAATPLAANNCAVYADRAQPAQYSVRGGLFSSGESFSVQLSAQAGARIYYTLDCTDPDESSILYTGDPIPVTGTTILRTRVYMDGCLPSVMDCQSYLYDVIGAQDLSYVVSLVSDPANLFSEETGIMAMGPNAWKEFPHGDYGRGANFWMDWEREAHVELFVPGGETAISQECGVKIHGRNSRAYDQKPMKVIARAAYGDAGFDYPIFSDRPYDSYNAFLLRYSGQDYVYTFMRDPVLVALAADTDVLYQEAEEGICYINGKYYSALYVREHISPFSICRANGWDGQEDDIDLVKGGYSVMQGSNDTYAALREWLLANDPTTQEAYDRINNIIDIDNFIEYVSLMVYICPADTVNVKRYRNPNTDGKWKWVLYDVDRGMRGDNDGFALMAQGTNGPLFEACMKNPTIRDRFLKRLNELLATTFSAQNTLPMLQAQYEKLQPVLPQYLDMIGRDMDDYNDRMGSLVRAVRNRPTQVLKDCVAYLGLNEAQFNSYFADAIASIEAYGK